MSGVSPALQLHKLLQTKRRHELKLAGAQHRHKRRVQSDERLKLRMAALIIDIGWENEPLAELERRLRSVQTRLDNYKAPLDEVIPRQQERTDEPGIFTSSRSNEELQIRLNHLLEIGGLCMNCGLDNHPIDHVKKALQQIDRQLDKATTK